MKHKGVWKVKVRRDVDNPFVGPRNLYFMTPATKDLILGEIPSLRSAETIGIKDFRINNFSTCFYNIHL